jgi:hypothetical protein
MTEKSDFIPYPDLDNKDFYQKIYKKKEFYDTKPPPHPDPDDHSKETLAKLFSRDGDFKLSSAQRFVRNFISEETPYNSIFLWWGTGVGKTCAAISIAERFHERVELTGKKILMIVGPNIRGEFIKTIFNFEKEASKKYSRQVVQCTGRTYQIGVEGKYMSEKMKEKRITKMIKDIYEIIGTDKLRNMIIRETGWFGKKEKMSELVKEKIKELFSDRVIVIDEVHNRVSTEGKDQSIPSILKSIICHAENVHLVLLSATPMVNAPEDIMFPINLMRLNDRRPQVKKKDIFNSEGHFLKNGRELLGEASKGYFSYVRGGEPPRFPYELTPSEAQVPNPVYSIEGDKIPPEKKMVSTKVIFCKMSDYQYRTYKAVVNKEKEGKTGGLLTGALQSGNIVFPYHTGGYGVYGSAGIGNKSDEDFALIKTKDRRGNDVYQYNHFSEGFLLEHKVKKYSTKFYEIFQKIIKSKGISFVYSQFLSAGVTTLALMLEENGFIPALITGKETEMLRSKTKKPPICYMCGQIKHGKTDHVWSPAKYVLLTGSQQLNAETDIPKISGYINREENMYGKLVKVLLGSEVSGEGIDFKRIRQVHIVEPWYNQARIDQVKGRAIRNGSHLDLPPEERNVEIFKYCIVPNKRKTEDEKIETVDERDYRYAEDKDRKIKAAEHVLKMYAVDCLFEKNNNLRTVRRLVKLENSRGQIINYETGDKPYSRECDYMEKCVYECKGKIDTDEKIEIDKSTYGPKFAQTDVEKSRELIQNLFREHFTVDVSKIFDYIQKKDPNIDRIYIYLALESLMNPEGEYSIQDRYGREGYIIERDDLFIYQPFDIDDQYAPMWYRKNPLQTKVADAPFPIMEIAESGETTENVPLKNGEDIYADVNKSLVKNKKILSIYTKKIESFKHIVLSIILDSLPDKWVMELLKFLLSPLRSKNIGTDIIKYFDKKGYILDKDEKKSHSRKAILVGNYCSQWGRAVFGIKKKMRKNWGKCDVDVETFLETNIKDIAHKEMWKKFPTNKKTRQGENITRSGYLFLAKQSEILPEFIGTVELPTLNSEQKSFKLLDFTREEEITRKDKERSKRSEIRGRVCSTFNVSYLLKTLGKVEDIVEKKKIKDFSIPKEKRKASRYNMCLRLEFLLRLLNEKDSKLWFYIGTFIEE